MTHETEMPNWPPQRSAVGLPDGTQARGSTGQLFEVKNGQWRRLPMGLFTREQFANSDEEDAGIFMAGLGQALVTWAAMQMQPVTVHDAAKTFNTTPEVIAEAVEEAMWISINGDTLELDGA